MRTQHSVWLLSAAVISAAAYGCSQGPGDRNEPTTSSEAQLGYGFGHSHGAVNTGSYNLLLQKSFRFNPIQPGSDPDNGRARFGLAADLVTIDPTNALFEGVSMAAQGPIASNGRVCATCHRGENVAFGMPAPPMTDNVALSDPLFTGIDADAQGDPDGFNNLNNLGLFKYRPNRFNPMIPQSDGFRKVFFWRKSPRLVNVAFNHGFLMDGRARVMFEAARGAVFSHTQVGDERFDDLVPLSDANDIEAFLFSLVSDSRLLALRDSSDPLYQQLTHDPFYTVPIATWGQWRGSHVFKQQCMSCHSTPNVFNNLDNVEPIGNSRPVTDAAWGPGVGRNFNIGVAEANKHNLRFTEYTGSGYQPVVVSLAAENGAIVNHTVTFDIGLAASSRRVEDIGRFKVPQLRGVKDAAPYFHDNSAATLEEAVDYHNGPEFRHSKDGKRHPIHLSPQQRADLLAFLRIL